MYTLCQALDLRAMQDELNTGMSRIIQDQLTANFGKYAPSVDLGELYESIWRAISLSLETTSTMDAVPRMVKVANASTTPIADFFVARGAAEALSGLPTFKTEVAEQSAELLQKLREAYLTGTKGPAPASAYLGKTRPVYEFIRVTLGVHMHGRENLHYFEQGAGNEEVSVGTNISLIYEVRFFVDHCLKSVLIPLCF